MAGGRDPTTRVGGDCGQSRQAAGGRAGTDCPSDDGKGGLAPSRRARLCRCVSRATTPALEPTARPPAEAPFLTSPRGCPAVAVTLLSPPGGHGVGLASNSHGVRVSASTTRTETIPSDGPPSRALPGRPGDTAPGLGSVSSEEGTGGPEDAWVPAPLLQSNSRGAVCGADARVWSHPGPGAHFNDGHAEAQGHTEGE